MAALVKGREKIKNLEQSRSRMEALYADYLARSIETEKKSLRMQETVNFRGFLQQIQTLIKRVDIDLQHAKFELDILKANLLAAEKNAFKWKLCKSKMSGELETPQLSANNVKWMLRA